MVKCGDSYLPILCAQVDTYRIRPAIDERSKCKISSGCNNTGEVIVIQTICLSFSAATQVKGIKRATNVVLVYQKCILVCTAFIDRY